MKRTAEAVWYVSIIEAFCHTSTLYRSYKKMYTNLHILTSNTTNNTTQIRNNQVPPAWVNWRKTRRWTDPSSFSSRVSACQIQWFSWPTQPIISSYGSSRYRLHASFSLASPTCSARGLAGSAPQKVIQGLIVDQSHSIPAHFVSFLLWYPGTWPLPDHHLIPY